MASFSSIPSNIELIYTPAWDFGEQWGLVPSAPSLINLTLRALQESPTALPNLTSIEIRPSDETPITLNIPASRTGSFSNAPIDPVDGGKADGTPMTSNTLTSTTGSLSNAPTDPGDGGKTDVTSSSTSIASTNSPSSHVTIKSSTSFPRTQTTAPKTPTSPNNTISSTSDSPVPLRTASPVSTSTGLGPSQAAGLAIGCLFAGAIIAIAAACIFVQRCRRRSMVLSKGKRMRVPDSDRDKRSSTTILRHLEKQPASPSFDLLLAPPIPDSELVAMFKKLQELITSHVEKNLAGNTPTDTQNPEPSFNQRLSDLAGPACLLGPHNLAKMLLERQTQSIAAKHFLAKSILSNIESSGPPENTLLPPELSECMASMAGLKSEAQVRATLLAKWRQITRILMESAYGRGTSIGSADPRQINIRELADSIDQLLKPFGKETQSEQRLQSLTEAICEGARFGYTLFTQPSEWRFEWKSARPSGYGQAHEFVVFPAFCKVVDDSGYLLSAPEIRDPAVIPRDV